MITGISIIICCYNSASRLENTIKHIALQKEVDFSFEVIVVDNNSTDNTAKIANDLFLIYKIENHKIVSEPKPGLTEARKCGVKSASYDILIFCDDDNWLEENYFINVIKGFESYPSAGILGAWSVPSFDDGQIVPNWFYSIQNNFAVGNKPDTDKEVYHVWGAGLTIKKTIADQIFEEPFFTQDRNGNALLGGGDYEICDKTIALGFKVYQLKALHFTHYITSNRLNWDYVKRLYIGHGIQEMALIHNKYNKGNVRLLLANSLLVIKYVIIKRKSFCKFMIKQKGALDVLPFYYRIGMFKYLISQLRASKHSKTTLI